MSFVFFLLLFFLFLLLYLLYSSFSVQSFVRRKKILRSLVYPFKEKVKGFYIPKGFFAVGHRVVSFSKYDSYTVRNKRLFTNCFNVVTFKTEHSNWELFFYLIKDGPKFNEIMTIRVFPKGKRIRSEGNVEKNYGKLNIYTNNRYLTSILEEPTNRDYLKWLLRYNEDILLISHNNLHFKAFIEPSKLSISRLMDIIKALNAIEKSIYKEDTIEY